MNDNRLFSFDDPFGNFYLLSSVLDAHPYSNVKHKTIHMIFLNTLNLLYILSFYLLAVNSSDCLAY